ncbi:sigma-70 family RNA polymerase sigma factor [Candidatus Peregrinibacteria bacterium]|nr:sigma-70 family RNA polymerase sigma factor [Candidatus Peregrinibacteria bacterium]
MTNSQVELWINNAMLFWQFLAEMGKTELDNEQKERIELWVKQAQSGDWSAFAKLYEYFVDKVYKYIYFKSSQEEAMDLTETVFLKVWENLKNYKPKTGSSFGSWVFRIAHNLLVDHYRLRKETSELKEIHADQRDEASPVFLAEQSLARRGLHQAMSKLKEIYREVLTLSYLNGLTNAEVAEIMKKSEGGLRVLKFRALQELKKILEQMGLKY